MSGIVVLALGLVVPISVSFVVVSASFILPSAAFIPASTSSVAVDCNRVRSPRKIMPGTGAIVSLAGEFVRE
ncbi:MAG: hypothetical protein ACREL5_12035, partial [Gemmatimonadales bacterium]